MCLAHDTPFFWSYYFCGSFVVVLYVPSHPPLQTRFRLLTLQFGASCSMQTLLTSVCILVVTTNLVLTTTYSSSASSSTTSSSLGASCKPGSSSWAWPRSCGGAIAMGT